VKDIQTLIDLVGFTRWMFFALSVVALVRFRYMDKYRDAERPFKVGGPKSGLRWSFEIFKYVSLLDNLLGTPNN